ncbi:MAG: hypothetical protein K9L88_00865 [Chromatiaceae bacterium]|nr:hypothetical protein [Chromatiaceae bacterium]MCF8017686.1 hypothetical protein [Chromatiaceae bacterium]
MNQHEMGIALALLERLRLSRIPRLLALHERVSQGSRLDAADLRYLRDAQRLQPQWRLFPEFGPIFGGLARIYLEINTKALANEHGLLSKNTHGSVTKCDRGHFSVVKAG